jgi:hypothetical protein
MTADTVVFIGPSLAVAEAREIVRGDYRGPVSRGEVDALLEREPPRLIAIVDGNFFQGLSVSPKEILRALRAGCIVLGSSSIGALRAVELGAFGMIGVGKVFEQFRDGTFDSDDEVAMTYRADALSAITVPLVNIRYALTRARDEGLVTEHERRCLVRRARADYFVDRTYPKLIEYARRLLELPRADALADFLSHRAPDLKREDAIAMLHEARAILSADDPAEAVHARRNSMVRSSSTAPA